MALSARQTKIDRVSTALFALSAMALPWIDVLPLTTWLLIALGTWLVATCLWRKERAAWFEPDKLTLLLGVFYILQVAAWLRLPADQWTQLALQQKAPLVGIPLVVSLYIAQVKNGWPTVVKAFITGNLLACCYCLFSALAAFARSGMYEVFFYHAYSSPLRANAIYLSLSLLACMALLWRYHPLRPVALSTRSLGFLVSFLCLNLMLLASKTLLITCLLLFLFFAVSKRYRFKLPALSALTLLIFVTMFTDNPIKRRFTVLSLVSCRDALKQNDFTNFPFDGLNLRLVIWKMGIETLEAEDACLTGAKGRAYHYQLNEKFREHGMFEGNEVTGDTGYMNYDMHNQYIENLMQFGLAGVLLLLAILATVIAKAIRCRNELLVLLIILFSTAFLTESVLETQAGILLFTLTICGEWEQLKFSRPQP